MRNNSDNGDIVDSASFRRSMSYDITRAMAPRQLSHTVFAATDSKDKPPDIINNSVVVIVAVALWCDYLLLTLCIPILPKLLSSNFSPTMIALVFASKPIMQFFSNPLMGRFVDKHGPKWPLRWGLIILAFSTAIFAYGVSLGSTPNTAYTIVLVARSIQGVSSASIMSGGMTLCVMTHDENSRGTAMGLAMVGLAFGTLLGPPLGGIVGYFVNLWTPFLFVSVILLGVFIAQLVFLDKIIDESSSSPAGAAAGDGVVNAGEEEPSILSLLKDPQVKYVGLLAVTGNFVIGMIEPLIPIFLKNAFDEKLLYQGLIFGVASLAYLIFTPLAGMTSDAYPKWRCLVGGLFVMSFGMISFIFASSVGLTCFSLALVGAGIGFIDTPILPLLADILQTKFNGQGMGSIYALNDMFLSIGFALGPIVGASVQDSFDGSETSGFKKTALLMGLLVLCTVPGTWYFLRSVDVDVSTIVAAAGGGANDKPDNEQQQQYLQTKSSMHASNSKSSSSSRSSNNSISSRNTLQMSLIDNATHF